MLQCRSDITISPWRGFLKYLKHLFVLFIFLVLSFLFFRLCLDNGFWNGYDYVGLENSIMMHSDCAAAFESGPPFKFQPLVYSIHYLLFKCFFFDASGYFLFNILLHGLNSFLVYFLVSTLIRDRAVAVLAGLLFVFTVGSYGKTVMIASGLEDLVITFLTLCTMICYFHNELRREGKLLSPWYLLTLIFFFASMFTRSTSFAILGSFLAFNFFFRAERKRKVADSGFVILLVLAIVALVAKATLFHYTPPLYRQQPGAFMFVYYAIKNVIGYLVRMIFPVHTSHLVTGAVPAVRFVYRFATQIRILIALVVLSYSFFGFVFGNRTIRFFIAWTYIMVLPFAFFQFPGDWLNIRHLYLVSVGFVSTIAAGAVYCSRLISENRWRRFVPMVVPIAFILLSRFIVVQLDSSYGVKAASPIMAEYRKTLAEMYDDVYVDGDSLKMRRGP
jgi:hypothetical protein